MNKPKTTAIVLSPAVEDVERITDKNQRRRKDAAARKRAEKENKARNAAAAAGVIGTLVVAMFCAAVGPWWTAVSPIALMVGVMRKAGWV
ncbi:MAG: hypothetical protein ACI3VQ_06730 [Faecousia sp.]